MTHPRLGETLAMLAVVEGLRRELTAARDEVVHVALERGASLRQVAAVLGVAPNTVQKLNTRALSWSHLAVYARPEP